MKKAKSGERGSATRKRVAKSGAVKTVEGYFAGLPTPARTALQEMRVAIRAEMPAGGSEVISYGIPAFRDKQVLVWYAAFAKHLSLFPTAEVIAEYREELKDFVVSKGTVKFALGKPLPIALIKKMVKARVEKANANKRK
jgi:uncharacterized protein YdhG (YjbR/CyaY superfamily)